MSGVPLLAADRLSVHFPVRSGLLNRTTGWVRAVNEVSLQVHRGETVALVGESGCGKTTLGRGLLRLLEPTDGRVSFDGTDITHLPERALRPFRRRMQIVFQDPYGSLNPRHTVASILAEPLQVHGLVPASDIDRRVGELLDLVGLARAALHKYPHEFSGGQRQRIGIARALSVGPELVLADEPVSALDVSVQAQILNLLQDLRGELGLTLVLISHDLHVVEHLADRVLVMYLGRIVESLPADGLSERAVHPYARALLSAVPDVEGEARRERVVLDGDVPSPMDLPAGCAFRGRCPLAQVSCAEEVPKLVEIGPGHAVACPVVLGNQRSQARMSDGGGSQ